MWRERENTPPVTGITPLGGRRSSNEGEGRRRQQDVWRGGGGSVEPEKVFEASRLGVDALGQRTKADGVVLVSPADRFGASSHRSHGGF